MSVVIEWATQTRRVGSMGWDVPLSEDSEQGARKELKRIADAYAINGYGEVRLLCRIVPEWETVGDHRNCWERENPKQHRDPESKPTPRDSQ